MFALVRLHHPHRPLPIPITTLILHHHIIETNLKVVLVAVVDVSLVTLIIVIIIVPMIIMERLIAVPMIVDITVQTVLQAHR